MKHWQFCLCLERPSLPKGSSYLVWRVMSCCASPPLHVCSPVPALSRLSAVPWVCLLTSLCSQFPAFQSVLLPRRSLHLPGCSCVPSLGSFCTVNLMSWFTHPSAPEGLILLSIYIRLLFFPSPLFLPVFGAHDRVLPALSSCALCHTKLQHLGAAVAKKSLA